MALALTPDAILAARAENTGLRERDLAAKLGLSEAALVAAGVGIDATRIAADPALLLKHVKPLGEVMVLTRNESAVHEKIGRFEDLHPGKQVSMTLGENIDLRIFGNRWKHGFAVVREQGGETKRSLQFFDAGGTAVFKLHLRATSNVEAFEALVAALATDSQERTFQPEEAASPATLAPSVDPAILRGEWQAMTDPHQFFGMLKKLNIGRQTAIRTVGDDFAWKLEPGATAALLDRVAAEGIEIMCFVANPGCVQIHTGTLYQIHRMGPWINVMDPTFHLHLRQDHIAEAWVVRKPSDNGHVTSVEVYDAHGEMIIQFFGKRKEGKAELDAWRSLAETLPRAGAIAA